MAEEPSDRLLVVQGWIGPRTVKRLRPDEPDPSPDEIAELEARLVNIGHVRPTLRVIRRSRSLPPPPPEAA